MVCSVPYYVSRARYREDVLEPRYPYGARNYRNNQCRRVFFLVEPAAGSRVEQAKML